jgi:NAD(P)-dependent dehydrogenase (short-subunit alcohol dehydrogenase family)
MASSIPLSKSIQTAYATNEKKGNADMSNRVILITGASGGVGGATAEKFLNDGCNVLMTDVNEKGLVDKVSNLQQQHGDRAQGAAADITRPDECKRLVAETVEMFGRLDVLVNCAGTIVRGDPAEMTEHDWDFCVDVNLKGTFFMCASAIPELKKSAGNIVNVASDAGVQGIVDHAIYCASKFGVVGMTKSMALELAPDGVRANSVCPSDIMSPMLMREAESSGKDPEVHLAENLATYPQGNQSRYIQPNEVANILFFIASDEASMITGAAVNMDFGSSAGLW